MSNVFIKAQQINELQCHLHNSSNKQTP